MCGLCGGREGEQADLLEVGGRLASRLASRGGLLPLCLPLADDLLLCI